MTTHKEDTKEKHAAFSLDDLADAPLGRVARRNADTSRWLRVQGKDSV